LVGDGVLLAEKHYFRAFLAEKIGNFAPTLLIYEFDSGIVVRF
jgi:hypothetical protein